MALKGGTDRARATAVALLAVVLVAPAGCQRDEPPQPEPTGASTPVPVSPQPTTPVPADPEAAALATYQGMWAAFTAADAVADPDHPELPRYATGDALELLVAGIEANRREGLVGEGEIVLNPEVVEVSPPETPVEVTIRDCADTSDTRRVRPTGPPFTDSPGGRRLVTATVELLDGSWKVIALGVREVGSCVPEA